MIELNVRLETSLDEKDYAYFSHINNLDLDDEFIAKQKLNYAKHTYEDYIEARKYALSLLKDEDSIKYALKSLISRLFRNNYVYFELGFNPYLYKDTGLDQNKLLDIILDTFDEVLPKYQGLEGGVILYLDRRANKKYNEETFALFKDYAHELRLLGLGLEGDDRGKPIKEFEYLLAPIRDLNIPLVVELGKNYHNDKSIYNAIKLGARRILNPYELDLSDATLLQDIFKNHVNFEIRPTMDIFLGNIKEIEDIKIKEYWMQGYPYYIAGSAHYILDADLIREFTHLNYHLDFKREDVQHALLNSLNASFIKDAYLKGKIIREYTKMFNDFYDKVI